MNEDNDLKRMFEAQRRVDEDLAPPFDDFQAEPHVASSRPVERTSPPRFAAALLVLTLTVMVGFVGWINVRPPDDPNEMAHLQTINHTCDALLNRITMLDSRPTANVRNRDSEMEWTTHTDQLVPFNTLTFSERTSP